MHDEKEQKTILALCRLKEAPSHGQALAYTRNRVYFAAYDDIEMVKKELENDELLELHLFDDVKEYRCILSESRRFSSDGAGYYIEAVVDQYFGEDEKNKDTLLSNTYEETVFLENGYGDKKSRIVVINHICYDENGMAKIDNYRLKMKKLQIEDGREEA